MPGNEHAMLYFDNFPKLGTDFHIQERPNFNSMVEFLPKHLTTMMYWCELISWTTRMKGNLALGHETDRQGGSGAAHRIRGQLRPSRSISGLELHTWSTEANERSGRRAKDLLFPNKFLDHGMFRSYVKNDRVFL